ncbi:MAG: hypothetical protein L6R38_005809, partial [Xanthoria sp. 2 TBL-2021]
MTTPVRRRHLPHRTVSAPVSSSDLTRKLLATNPPSGPFLLNYHSLPAWHQDNAYILTSYRPAPTYSLAKCLQSLLYLHNETINIHSHLLGSFLFLFIGLFLYLLEGRDPGVEKADVIVFGIFFAAVVGCLGVSAAYHTISILGTGCTIVSVTPEFRTPKWRPFRASMFVAMGLSAVVPVLHGVKLYGLQKMNDRIGLSWLILQGFLYVLGAGTYA